MLHGLQNARVGEQQTGAAQQLLPQLTQGLLIGIPRCGHDALLCRDIQRTRRLNRVKFLRKPFPVPLRRAVLDREQIDHQLHIQSVPQVGQFKLFGSALVIHHTDVQPVVLDIAVHAVDLADQLELSVFVLHHNGRQVAVIRKTQLKIQRTEIRAGEFLHQIVQNPVKRSRQTTEQIAEPVGMILHSAEECLHILARPQLRGFAHSLTRDAAPLAVRSEYILQDMLEHIVQEGSALRRVKLCPPPLLRPQSVAHEIGKPAARKGIHARRGEADFVPVQSAHGLFLGETAAMRCPVRVRHLISERPHRRNRCR